MICSNDLLSLNFKFKACIISSTMPLGTCATASPLSLLFKSIEIRSLAPGSALGNTVTCSIKKSYVSRSPSNFGKNFSIAV